MNSPSPRAVVVNDDPTQLNVLCGLLCKAGLAPHAFTGAEAALADMFARAGTCPPGGGGRQAADGVPGVLPALIVTDLYMPGIDGWRFCRLLRSPEYAALNQVPILVVSATFAGEETDRIAAELGAEAFLPSPVDGQRFVDQVRALLRGERLRPRLRVLIVEDSQTLAGMLQRAFAAHGYQADTALTARAAADAFTHTAYDVAVLDYHLPDGSGDALLDAFRVGRPECVCLMMTTDPGPDLALDWMKRGAAAYLHKPFEPDYLIELCAKARRERALLRVQDLLEVRTRELRESSELFSLFMRHSPIYTYIKAVTPTESRVLQASDNYQQMIGISGAEMVGKTMAELFPAEIAAKMTTDDWAVVTSGEVLKLDEDLNGRNYASIKFPIVLRDRTLLAGYTIDITERRRADEALKDSEYSLALTHAADITERMRAEQALKRRSVFVENLLEQAPIGFAVNTMSDGRPLFVSRNFETIYGVAPESIQSVADFFEKVYLDPVFRETIRERMMADMATGEAARMRWEDIPITTLAGEHKVVTAINIPLPEQNLMISTVQDVTVRKRAEEEKAKLEAQLRQAHKMESVGRLAGGVAHDFNNMLGAILGHAELALEQVDPAHPIHADLMEIQKAAQRSADLTRQLLAFARKQTIAPKVLDLNETVEGMLTMLRRLIGEDIDLAWLPGKNLWPIKVDPSQIDQTLANLCVNARHAVADVGTITIETGNRTVDEDSCAAHPGLVPGAYVRLTVSDTGCGMDTDTLAHIFEPFFTTKGVGEGTGLGLATVYGIVKQNNGFVFADSEPGQGTTVTIYLPRHAGKADQMRKEGPAEPAARGHETILLVEDEPAILKLTTMMLERQGYTVLAASTPGEAIRLAPEYAGEIRLLMTDVVMPEMNGRDLARNLRSLYPRIERLFMSGYPADVIAHHGVLDEGVFFIQKPFSIKDLAAKVREALDRK